MFKIRIIFRDVSRIYKKCRIRINKQLLNEVEHDIENYQGRGWCYPPKPKAEVDNSNRGLDNSRYHAKTEFNNCFIMYSKPKNKEQYKWNTRKFHVKLILPAFMNNVNVLSMQQCF